MNASSNVTIPLVLKERSAATCTGLSCVALTLCPFLFPTLPAVPFTITADVMTMSAKPAGQAQHHASITTTCTDPIPTGCPTCAPFCPTCKLCCDEDPTPTMENECATCTPSIGIPHEVPGSCVGKAPGERCQVWGTLLWHNIKGNHCHLLTGEVSGRLCRKLRGCIGHVWA